MKKMRIRLDLTDCQDILNKNAASHPFCWILITTLNVSNISRLKDEIRKRREIKNNAEFSLYLDGAFVPNDESIEILHDGDVLKIVPVYDENCKKKRKNSSSDVEILDDNESQNNVASNRERRSKRFKKSLAVDSNDAAAVEVVETSRHHSKKKSSKHDKKSKSRKHSGDFQVLELPQPLPDLNIEVSVPIEKTPPKSKKNREKKHISNDIEVIEAVPSCSNMKTEHADLELKTEITTLDSGSDSFNEEIVEVGCKPSSKRVRKRRKKNRKIKLEENDGIFTSTPAVFDLNPFEPSRDFVNSKNSNGNESSNVSKHIRFGSLKNESPEGEGQSVDVSFNDDNTRKSNYFSMNETNSTPCGTPVASTSQGERSLGEKLLEMSKTRQIKSKLENHSVILMNCENTEPTILNGTCKELNESCRTLNIPPPTNSSDPSLKSTKGKTWTPLVGPPRIGDFIAYKVLELSETYCPEVSKFKTAQVVGYDPSDDTLELDVLSEEIKAVSFGKFDLIDEEDDTEVETRNNETTVKVKWLDLIEPKLIS